ncbi:MAG: hypothetical protein IK990_04180 [Ruminiclostridium sp.]|nr:hypothetical protein [Ruminiclostridium sp.]
MNYTNYDIIKIKTKNNEVLWNDIHGIAPAGTAIIMDKAMLNWLTKLTNTLEIWINKGENMTTGELLLARVNLGSIVEFWLRHFYTAYHEDYMKNPIRDKKQRIKAPEKDLSFEELKKLSTGILWDDEKDNMYKWVDSVQHKRNAVHSYLYKEIGTVSDFLNDINTLRSFIELIERRLPSVLNCLDEIPAEYVDLDGYFLI